MTTREGTIQTRPGSGRRLAINAAAGWGANLGKIAIQVVLLPLMAHMLGPAEFGLYALALPTVGFFTVLADGGLGSSLAREEESNVLVWSTAFWTLMATGLVLLLITVVSGYGLAVLSQQPALFALMATLSLGYIPITMAVIPSARLTRRGLLVVQSGADLVSTMLGAVAAISMGMAHFGAYALVGQYLTTAIVRALVVNGAAFVRPSMVFDFGALRSHLRVGGALLGSRLVEFLGRAFETVLFGRLFGTAALGGFTFANQLSRFLTEAAANPIWAALYAHALHADTAAVAAAHRRFCRLLATVLFPLTMLLAAAAPQLFGFTLGARWAGAVTMVRIVAPFYALNAIAMTNGAILLASGHSKGLFWGISSIAIARVLAVGSGAIVGQTGVAWGIGASTVVGAVVLFATAARITREVMPASLFPLLRPLCAGIVAAMVCGGVLMQRPESLPLLTGAILLGAVTYLVTLVALEGEQLIADLRAIYRLVLGGSGRQV